jgi:hypothetical protein
MFKIKKIIFYICVIRLPLIYKNFTKNNIKKKIKYFN